VSEIEQIAPDVIRAYLLELEARGANPGGRHAKSRALRAFLTWYQAEAEPDGWTNPITKVKPPKVEVEPIEGISPEDVKRLLAACPDTFTGIRDRAILLCLLDTGARMREFLALDLADVDTIAGNVVIRKGKNRRPRIVFIGKRTRRALRAYLRLRTDSSPALWVTSAGDRLAPRSLQSMLERRAAQAGTDAPSPHDFRRACALAMIRAGVDVFTLQRLMGHSDLSVLRVYLAQDANDLERAFEKASPSDRL
jgi:integrase/recombinase XerC/integrase/recombinase XerD